MSNLALFSLILSILVSCYFCLFVFASYREKKYRAMFMSAIIIIFHGAGVYLLIITANPAVMLIYSVVTLSAIFLFFAPFRSPSQITIDPCDDQVDERDTMFAREELIPGSEKYNRYYASRPEYLEIDDRLRKLPPLLSEGGYYYQKERARAVKDTFRRIQKLTTKVDGEVSSEKRLVDSKKISEELKAKVLHMGGAEVGVARLDQRYVYSHVGRGPEEWGRPIELKHPFAIVFTLEMDYFEVEQAPDLPITEEAARQYYKGANISVELARYIRSLGYEARAHISDSNYQIMLPPVAYDAGLGEVSRMGYLISQKFGSRVRLGGVTTTLPLVADGPKPFGVQDFCEVCLKCADNCPSAAIPDGGTTKVRGVEKWPLNIEQCLKYWRTAGTDCGICMKVCPYSHPPTIVHNIIRYGLQNSAFARRVSIWGDDFFYGRKISYKR